MIPPQQRDWREILFNRKMLICVSMGFASGLPLYVLIQLVPAWLRSHQVDLATIGLFSLISFPYTWKFVWSPVMDRFKPPWLGRRRGWALITQIGLIFSIGALGLWDPGQSMKTIVGIVLLVAIFSASQDIVLDAYRRELLADDELGTGTSIWVNAYRLSSLVPASLAMTLSDILPWSSVFWITGAFMGLGIVAILLVEEVSDDALAPRTLRESVVEPFREFFNRRGYRLAFQILGFMLLYKLGDSMATALSTPFYLDMGFSRTEIGTIAKFASLWSSIAGTFIGGIIMLKLNINRSLWAFGFVQLASIFGFAYLAEVGHSPATLFWVVSFEYLGVGLGSVALTAYLARETSLAFSATQFALFSSFVSIPRIFANASTGFIVEAVGYTRFFVLCGAVAVPGLLMLLIVAPWNDPDQASEKVIG